MSIISTVVKAALSLEQSVQGAISKGAHLMESRNFNAGETAEQLALVRTEDTILNLERLRAKRATDLIQAHKRAMNRLHDEIDSEIELAQGYKLVLLGKARQHKQNAVLWQASSINAQVTAENARKAAAQLS